MNVLLPSQTEAAPPIAVPPSGEAIAELRPRPLAQRRPNPASEELCRSDRAYEERFLALLTELNACIAGTGEPLEGNLCYWDQTSLAEHLAARPIDDEDHVRKRINLSRVSSLSRSFLEIGLNGGHSALLLLYSNPQLILHSVDICDHEYTKHAADFLKCTFKYRFQFTAGDSREVLPTMFIEQPALRFDCFHIDGGHRAELVTADISNAIRLARRGAFFVVDDLQAAHLYRVFERFVRLGHFGVPADPPFLATRLHSVVTLLNGND
jgi:methyltransferase family protein